MDGSRCPGCRARLGDGPVCARCGCDLGLVRRARAQAMRHLALALRELDAEDIDAARAHAQAAVALDRSPPARALLQALSAVSTGQAGTD